MSLNPNPAAGDLDAFFSATLADSDPEIADVIGKELGRQRVPVGQAVEGADVLLGNSATSSNNHVEALELLRDRVAADAHVVVPLSYGHAGYADRVEALGRALLAERFDPLRGWMSLDAYNERIRRCGTVVMNHRRQQAVGNIGAALYKGAAVYLRPENPLYPFYRSLGIAVRAIDVLATAPLTPLSPEDHQRNRRAIAGYYCRARVVDSIRRLAG